MQNPITRLAQEAARKSLSERFSVLEQLSHGDYLSLQRYLTCTPQKFYCESAFEEYLLYLLQTERQHPNDLKTALNKYHADIELALTQLNEINEQHWHDRQEIVGDFELLRFIDQRLHPSYLRVVEAVFSRLLRMVAYLSRIARGKGTDGLELWSIVDEVQKHVNKNFIASYSHVMRNAIAHGGIVYGNHKVRYTDKNETIEFSTSSIIRRFDDLLDSCNGMALALKLFLLCRTTDFRLPKPFFIDELRAQTASPFWTVSACVESEIPQGRQLIIYCVPRTYDVSKVVFSVCQTGILAERLTPGFNRYFFSLKASDSWQGWASMDGDKLLASRLKSDGDDTKYEGVLSDFFYVPRFKLPSWLGRVELYVAAYRVALRSTLDIKKDVDISVRSCSIHRTRWWAVISGNVVLKRVNGEYVDKKNVREMIHRIYHRTCWSARRSGSGFSKILPAGFVKISIYNKDFRRRRLQSFGLAKELVCTIEAKRLSQIQSPDIFFSEIEIFEGYRIAWNRSWLESQVE